MKFINTLPHYEPGCISKKLPGASKLAIDLLRRILVYDTKSRITAAELLNHPYLEEYQDELLEDELQAKASLEPSFSFAVETDNSLIEWEKKVVDLINDFKLEFYQGQGDAQG
jgi:p38 MAP kinase